jgi:hypothetical protein
MITVHGINHNTVEYKAADELAKAVSAKLPEANDSQEIVVEIFPNVQCFGQSPQDIDLLVMFADYRASDKLLHAKGERKIHSFCVTIEVKSHTRESVWFEGPNCFVRYNNREHNVTSQSEAQKYSVKNYIERNSRNSTSPWINNLIWLLNVSSSDLPESENNILGSDAGWEDIINKIAFLTRGDIKTFSSRPWLTSIIKIFGKRLEASKVDRRRIEAITKSILDRDRQQYAEKLGKQLLVIRGRGGTGKTVRLIQIASQAYDEYGMRVILLTYNRALVADITRLLSIQGVRNTTGEPGMMVRTIHSFVREWLVALSVIPKKCPDFIDNYEDYKRKTLEFLSHEVITKKDIQMARVSRSRDLDWDLVLIDESQDWPASERDLLYRFYNPDSIVIADGVDQFVRGVDRIDWREGMSRNNSQVIRLRKSMRLKAEICHVVKAIADELDIAEWDLEAIPESYGGKVYIAVGNGLSQKLHARIFLTAASDGNEPVDMLLCVPPSWVRQESSTQRVSRIADAYTTWGKEIWDGVNDKLRGEYPTSVDQYRIVQYDSCRGLEGWAVVCFALDNFFEHKKRIAEFSDDARQSLFFDENIASTQFAKKWLMIPLTRAIDTLVIHIQNPDSYIGGVLKTVHRKFPDVVKWEVYD